MRRTAVKIKSGEIEFKCIECGNCCKMPGYVFLNEKDIEEIANFFGLSKKEFENKYIKIYAGRKRTKDDYGEPCIFLKNNKCTIYKVRPKQCRTFPFWIESLKDNEYWQEISDYCGALKKIIVENGKGAGE